MDTNSSYQSFDRVNFSRACVLPALTQATFHTAMPFKCHLVSNRTFFFLLFDEILVYQRRVKKEFNVPSLK